MTSGLLLRCASESSFARMPPVAGQLRYGPRDSGLPRRRSSISTDQAPRCRSCGPGAAAGRRLAVAVQEHRSLLRAGLDRRRAGNRRAMSNLTRLAFCATRRGARSASRPPNRYAVKRACELSFPRKLLRLYRHRHPAGIRHLDMAARSGTAGYPLPLTFNPGLVTCAPAAVGSMMAKPQVFASMR